MTLTRRALVSALLLSPFLGDTVRAAPHRRNATPADRSSSWNGAWRGEWGGQEWEATTITIANNKVVSYEYHGVSTPIATSTATPTTVSYAHNGVSVTITRTGRTTASASLHSLMGDTKAQLTRQ